MRFVGVLMCIWMGCVSISHADEDALRILTEEYPPFNHQTPAGVGGTSTEIVLQVLRDLDMDIQRSDIELVPWAQAYKQTLEQKNTMIYSIVRVPQREDLFKWICPIGCLQVGLLARVDQNVQIDSPADLKRYQIGVVREDIAHQLLRDIIPEKDLDIASSSEVNLHKLKQGRIDLFAYDVNVATYLLNRVGLDPADYQTAYVLKEAPLCVAFNKETDDGLVDAFRGQLSKFLGQSKVHACGGR